MQPLSKTFYIGSFLGGIVFSFVLMIIAVVMFIIGGQNHNAEPLIFVGFGFYCFGLLGSVYAIVVLSVFVYKIWAAIQGGNPRSTPGKALGFCFIPFFNFYWIFVAYKGWAEDYNRYAETLNLSPRVSEGMALAMCIITLLAAIPYLGILFSLPNLIILPLFMSQAIDGVNAIAASQTQDHATA